MVASNAPFRDVLHSGHAIFTGLSGGRPSNRDGRRDVRVRVVRFENEVFRFVVERSIAHDP